MRLIFFYLNFELFKRDHCQSCGELHGDGKWGALLFFQVYMSKIKFICNFSDLDDADKDNKKKEND